MIAFKIGVEIAQLFVAAIATLVGLLIRESLYGSLMWKVARGALITAGLIGGAVLGADTAFTRPV